MNLSLYGLLHLADREQTTVNNKAKNFDRQIEIYLMNAINLAHSLQVRGSDFTLLTNRPKWLSVQLQQLDRSHPVKVRGIDFSTQVPTGTKFYSAHFKLDAFAYLGTLPADRYVGLIDLDVIAIGQIPAVFQTIAATKTPIYYDITNQVISTYGRDTILQDLQKLVPTIDTVRWSGGEFLTGSPDFFRSLATEIGELYPKYLQEIANFHHHGDEMLTSAALAKLRQAGMKIVEGGELEIVGRFWSYPPKHSQPPFRHFERVFLLHLPSDKQFLATLTTTDAQERDRFLDRYRIYLPGKVLMSTLHQHKIALSTRLRRVNLAARSLLELFTKNGKDLDLAATIDRDVNQAEPSQVGTTTLERNP
jgi:hypothetical protein